MKPRGTARAPRLALRMIPFLRAATSSSVTSRGRQYALGLGWGDAHDTGIYSFRYLRALGDLLDAQGTEAVKAQGTLPRI